MTPFSNNRLFSRSSRKREAGRMAPENAIAFLVRAISITATLVILSGGISRPLNRRPGSMTT